MGKLEIESNFGYFLPNVGHDNLNEDQQNFPSSQTSEEPP